MPPFLAFFILATLAIAVAILIPYIAEDIPPEQDHDNWTPFGPIPGEDRPEAHHKN